MLLEFKLTGELNQLCIVSGPSGGFSSSNWTFALDRSSLPLRLHERLKFLLEKFLFLGEISLFCRLIDFNENHSSCHQRFSSNFFSFNCDFARFIRTILDMLSVSLRKCASILLMIEQTYIVNANTLCLRKQEELKLY